MSYTVIKLTPSKKVKDRYYVDFSEGDSFTITINQIADYSIYTGRELHDEEYADLKRDAEKTGAKSKALRILGSRNLSKKEMTKKLMGKEISQETADETAAWLENIGAINDEEYSATIVRHYAGKGYGLGRVRDELYRRGIPRDMWDDALLNMPETEDIVYKVFLSKLRSDQPDKKEITKAANALYRRGYSWDEIKSAINKFETEGL